VDLVDFHGFYMDLDKTIDGTMQITLEYLQIFEEIEDQFYTGKTIKNFNKQWFEYKNTIVRVNRVLSKAIEAFQKLLAIYKKEEDFLERNFEDLQEHLNRAYRNSGFLLEKLDALYNFHLTQTNEQMNRIVYVLTLLSGIFLPLNLIVGFFGMNTTSLPFTTIEGGTYNVIFLLAISALLATLLTLFMKRK
jgi:magnesium transporter